MIPTEYEQFERVVTVGTANFSPVWGDAKRTLAKIEANVVEAAAQGVDVLAFPEEALVGATTCDACRAEAGPCDLHVEEAQTVPGPATDHVVDLAREHDLYVIFGLPERDAHEARGALQLGRGDRPRGAPGRVPQDPPRFPAVGDRGDGVPPRHVAPRLPDAVWTDRRADLLRLLVQPRAHAHPRAQGRASDRQLLQHVQGPGQGRLHAPDDKRARAGEPRLHRQRQRRRRSRAGELRRRRARRAAPRRLPRAQPDRRSRVPALQPGVCRSRRDGGDRRARPSASRSCTAGRRCSRCATGVPDTSSTRRSWWPTSSAALAEPR